MNDEISEYWISDDESFFAHLPHWDWGQARHTKCGITLGPYDVDRNTLIEAGVDKPRCSSCVDGMRVTMG